MQKGGEVKNPTAPDKASDIAKAEDKRIVPETGDNIGKTADKISKGEKPSMEFLYERATYDMYQNKATTKARFPKQSEKNLLKAVESKLNSKDIGDIAEGEVAKYIMENTSEKITLFSSDILDQAGGKIGEIDIMTENYLIEVKKSYKLIKEKQILKYTDVMNKNYINLGDKAVILFVKDEIIDKSIISIIESKYNNRIRVINSLEELGDILK